MIILTKNDAVIANHVTLIKNDTGLAGHVTYYANACDGIGISVETASAIFNRHSRPPHPQSQWIARRCPGELRDGRDSTIKVLGRSREVDERCLPHHHENQQWIAKGCLSQLHSGLAETRKEPKARCNRCNVSFVWYNITAHQDSATWEKKKFKIKDVPRLSRLRPDDRAIYVALESFRTR